MDDYRYAIRLRKELSRNYGELLRIEHSKDPIKVGYRRYLRWNMRMIKKELKEIGVR